MARRAVHVDSNMVLSNQPRERSQVEASASASLSISTARSGFHRRELDDELAFRSASRTWLESIASENALGWYRWSRTSRRRNRAKSEQVSMGANKLRFHA